MSLRTCATCHAFDRENTVHPEIREGDHRFPASSRCRAAPPPWQVVQDTDWCLAWRPRPKPAPSYHEDNGA